MVAMPDVSLRFRKPRHRHCCLTYVNWCGRIRYLFPTLEVEGTGKRTARPYTLNF